MGQSCSSQSSASTTASQEERRQREDPTFPSPDRATIEEDEEEEKQAEKEIEAEEHEGDDGVRFSGYEDPRFLWRMSTMKDALTKDVRCWCGAGMDPNSFRCEYRKTGAETVITVNCYNDLPGSGPHERKITNTEEKSDLNIDFCLSITHSGASLAQIQRFCGCMDMPCPGKSIYHIRDGQCAEYINEEWKKESAEVKAEVVERIRSSPTEKDGVILKGDGRYDSMGFNATWGTYVVMEHVSKKNHRIGDHEEVG
jgi:hypothetical protein